MTKIVQVMMCTLTFFLLKSVSYSQNTTDSSLEFFNSYVEVLLCEYGVCLHNCGGAILNEGIVLSGCHCVANISKKGEIKVIDTKKISVVAGAIGPSDSPTKQTIGAKEILVHPRCAFRVTMEFDTAVIALKKKLIFNERVHSLKMPSGDDTEILKKLYKFAGSDANCTIIGSLTEEEGSGEFDDDEEIEILEQEREDYETNNVSSLTNDISSPTMIAMKVKVLTSKICAETFCSLGFDNLCDHHFQGFGQVCVLPDISQLCLSDGGSPMVCEGEMYGIGSWGPKCAEGYPLVFAYISSVPKLLDDINKKMKSHRTKQRSSAIKISSSLIMIMMGQFLIAMVGVKLPRAFDIEWGKIL